jgi:hypothetical protein
VLGAQAAHEPAERDPHSARDERVIERRGHAGNIQTLQAN